MYSTNKSLYDRSLEKTPEQSFINSLRKEYELSPAEILGILELAKSCLFGEVPKILGKQKERKTGTLCSPIMYSLC